LLRLFYALTRQNASFPFGQSTSFRSFFSFSSYIRCMGIIYEAGLEEFLQFLNGLMEEAFWPYASVYRGKWNATSLRKEAERTFEEAMGNKRDPILLGKNLASFINIETMNFLMRHVSGLIYGPDLSVFGREIGQKLQKIVDKTSFDAINCKELALNA
jgi:hypothetical protein